MIVGLLPPLLLGGIGDAAAVRSCMELVKWVGRTFEYADNFLTESHRVGMAVLRDSGAGGLQTDYTMRLWLPSAMDSYENKVV